MRYNKMIISTIAVILLNTGCVKPTEEINGPKTPTTTTNETSVYNEEPTSIVYDDATSSNEPIIYSDPTGGGGTIYSNSTVTQPVSGGATDTITTTTPVTTTTTTTTPNPSDHYQPPQGGGYSTYGSSSSSGAYNDPYSSGGDYSSGTYGGGNYSGGSYGGGSYGPIDDPYSSTSSSSSANRYSTNIPYGSSSSSAPSYSSSSGSHSGIGLQVAALRSYASAEEFRRNLNLSPKYHSYIKRGALNRVIITGFSSRSEAKRLANRQFPGAFIVTTSDSSSSTSYSSNSSYTPSYSSYSSSGAGNIYSGIGVQVGAFSSKAKARAVAQEKAGGEYTAVVKTAKVRGRTIYKAILLGFSSRADAKRAIASGRFGDAFVVTGIYP